ncbi:S-type pyocin domain-containing protein [Pseudomonas sp. NY5710]|uniref:S-type pyocin domain-containing protein n=1 Tax=Pseudomonas sp. NY5710 TaxID=2662033 RepID=UPI001570E44C|nr:S-type pyocin domain-containing protein [Pseudomonas sp. NY5710]QKL04540.1 S-type pyocin domain-containing protein [Pseudomonas sp. NY5710]
MELRPELSQYEENSFLSLVEAIWHADADKASHDAWIAHFDSIVGHPAGSDLLFYSNADETDSINSPKHIVATIKSWHQQNGRAAFKGQTLQPPPVRQMLTPAQRASQSSNRNLEKVRKLAAEIQAAEQQGTLKFTALEQQLARAPAGGTPEQQLAASLAALRALELAQHQAKAAFDKLTRLQMPVKFALDGAKRDATSPFLNAATQAVVLREITASSQCHAAALASAQVRQPALYARGVELIESLETCIAQLAKATATGPGYGSLTLEAAAHSASLHPALLTVQGLPREVAKQQHQLVKTFRSAVAELDWQAASLQGDHPGTYADVVEFVLSTPSDDPRFAVTVPLVEMLESERTDWAVLAAERGEVDLPVRLCSTVGGATNGTSTGVKPFTRYSHVVMTATQGKIVPSRVRVRAAGWDASLQSYLFTSEGAAPVTVQWQTGRAPYARRDPSSPPSIGFLSMPLVPLIERFADLAQVKFDDYIVVFPDGSDLCPVYIMFRDRREF